MRQLESDEIFIGRMNGQVVLVEDFFGTNDRRNHFTVKESFTVVGPDEDVAINFVHYSLTNENAIYQLVSELDANVDVETASFVDKQGNAVPVKNCKSLELTMAILALPVNQKSTISKFKATETKEDFYFRGGSNQFASKVSELMQAASDTIAVSVTVNGKANCAKASKLKSRSDFNGLVTDFALMRA